MTALGIKDRVMVSEFHVFHRTVHNASEVMQIISGVLKLRAHCPTLVHTDSSRSHLVVTLTISSKSPSALALGEARWHAAHRLHRSSCSPQATESQEGHAALRSEGVVESPLSPCQPCRPPRI